MLPRLPHWLLLLALGLGIIAHRAHAEPAITTDDAPLFQGNRVKVTLPPDQIVDVQAAQNASTKYFDVTYNGQHYLAERRYFSSERDALDEIAKARIDNDAELAASDGEFKPRYERLDALYQAIIHCERDTALLFRSTNRNVSVQGDDVQVLVPTYDNERIVSTSKARRLTRDWEEGTEELNKQLDKLWDARLETMVNVARFESKAAAVANKFALFRANADPNPAQRYTVVGDFATLIQKRRKAGTLRAGQVVAGKPNPNVPGWVVVRAGDQLYDVDASEVISQPEIRVKFAARRARLDTAIHRQEEDIALMNNRMATYRRLAEDLDFVSRRDKSVVVLAGDRIVPGYGDVYVVEHPGKASIAVDRSQARKVLKDWEKEVAALDAALKEANEKLVSLKKDLVDVNSEETSLLNAFISK